MSTKWMLAITALGTFGVGTAFAAPQAGVMGGDDDPLPFTRAGEFMLQDGQIRGIADDKQVTAYRVCVGKAEQTPHELTALGSKTVRNVGLKVMFDGQASTVKPGTCSDFHARNIKVTPNRELGADEVLVGRFEHLG